MAARHDSARLGLPRPEPPERTCGEQPIDQPVENVLKIDRAFIARIDTDADNRAIVRTIVALAHNFGLKVVAEGTETLEEVNELLAIDCEYAQGYFFSRPLDETTCDAQKLIGSLYNIEKVHGLCKFHVSPEP